VNCRGADLADDHARRVVAEDGRLDRRRACRDGQRERRDDRVARAGNIEHFLRDGGNVKRLLPALAEQQAEIAERDEQHGGAQLVQEEAGGLHQIFVLEWIRVARVVRQAGEFKSFLAVRRDERERGEIQVMHRFRIEAQPDAALAAERLHSVEQRLGHDALAVIADDDGVRTRQRCFDHGQESLRVGGAEVAGRFAVHAHELLLMRDDARLDTGVPALDGDQAGAADMVQRELDAQLPLRLVTAHRAEQFGGRAERRKIAGDVGRAAGHKAFSLEFHHRHGCFRRNARDASPEKLIEHHVADDE